MEECSHFPGLGLLGANLFLPEGKREANTARNSGTFHLSRVVEHFKQSSLEGVCLCNKDANFH